MKVKLGQSYVFEPVMWDLMDPKTSLQKGDVVKVIRPAGCPPPNTMNHCHVEKDGRFMGLVHCNSLKPKV